MIPLTNHDNKSYRKQNVCHICKKRLLPMITIKNTIKFEITVIIPEIYTGVAHNIWNLRYKTPKKSHAVFYNGSKYDYHFIFKELPEEFKWQFECLGENTEK